MRLTILTFIVALLFLTPAEALISGEPDQTFLWNSFSGAVAVDSFLIVSGADGLAVCSYDSVESNFDPQEYLLLDGRPRSMKRFGDRLVVRSSVDLLYLVDVSDLPQIKLLASIDVGVDIYDYVLKDSSLYVCTGFDGLFRYQLVGNSTAVFADSSMVPVHCVAAAAYGELLYVVDDYNGVLTYDLSGEGFGQLVDFLPTLVPSVNVYSFESELVITTTTPTMYFANRADSGLVVTDSIQIGFVPRELHSVDDYMIAISTGGVWFGIIDRVSGEAERVPVVEPIVGDASAALFDRLIVMPTKAGGLHALDIDRLPWWTVTRSVWDHPGPINTALFYGDELFVAGSGNPMDLFSYWPQEKWEYSKTLYRALDNVRSADRTGDTLAVLYPGLQSIVMFEGPTSDLHYLDGITIDTSLTWRIKFNENKVGEFRSLFGFGQSHLDVYTYSDTLPFTKVEILQVLGAILDATVHDSILAISTNKRGLYFYRIYDDFSIEYRSNSLVSNSVFDLVSIDADSATGRFGMLVGFSGSEMLQFDLSDPSQPSVTERTTLELPTRAVTVEDNILYTIGPYGMAIYSLRDSVMELIDFGGRPGDIITVNKGQVVTSDGGSVMFYDLTSLIPEPSTTNGVSAQTQFNLANYPNPFNPQTTISFRAATAGPVRLSVYNVLGRRVATLLDRNLIAGEYSVVWNGTDDDGHQVASGVYLYLLQSGEMIESRKMLLLK